MLVSMFGTNYVWSACTHFKCDAIGPAEAVYNAKDKVTVILSLLPHFNLTATILYFGWVVGQAILYAILPTPIGYG